MTRSTLPRAAAALLLLLPLAPLAAGAQQAVVAPGLGTRLDSVVRIAEREGFSGVVRVEKDGQVLLKKGYGLANRARRTPFTPATLVQIGSNTKDFTLAALLRLQVRGALDLDDSLGKYFPGAPADKRAITLRQLVEHRGGFPIGFGGDFEPVTRADFVRRALEAPLSAPPGTRQIYSNAGYALLAAVIEQVTGTSYDRHIREDLLTPLGLHDTGFLLPAAARARVAHGYRNGADLGSILERPHAEDGPYWNLRGNGGMVSTVDEMSRFYRALIAEERLLPFAAREGHFDPGQPVGLAGSDRVHFFLFERLPGRRIELVIASNVAEHKAPDVRDALAPLLDLPQVDTGEEQIATGPPPGAQPPSPAIAAVLARFFATMNGGDSTVVLSFVREQFSTDGPPAAERVQRFRTMREALGTLTPGVTWMRPDGGVSAVVQTTLAGPATFVFDLEPAAPWRIRSLRVLVED